VQNPLKTKDSGAEKLRESADGSLQHASTVRLTIRPLHLSRLRRRNSRLYLHDLSYRQVQREGIFKTTEGYSDTWQATSVKGTRQNCSSHTHTLDHNHRPSNCWKLWSCRQPPFSSSAGLPRLCNRSDRSSVLLAIHLR